MQKVSRESTHTFFVTHWGANASMNPSPAISRTMPVKRPIRSWTPRYVNHSRIYYTSSKYLTRYTATRRQLDCNKNQLQNLIIIHISQSQNLQTALKMSKWIEKNTSIMRTILTWPRLRARSSGVSASSFIANGSAGAWQIVSHWDTPKNPHIKLSTCSSRECWRLETYHREIRVTVQSCPTQTLQPDVEGRHHESLHSKFDSEFRLWHGNPITENFLLQLSMLTQEETQLTYLIQE